MASSWRPLKKSRRASEIASCGEIGVVLVGNKHVEGRLQERDRLREVALQTPDEQPETRPYASSGMREPDALEPIDRSLEVRTCVECPKAEDRNLSRSLVELG